MQTANPEIRKTARAAGIPLWALAKELGLSEATMTRLLRVELPAEKKAELLASIQRLAEREVS